MTSSCTATSIYIAAQFRVKSRLPKSMLRALEKNQHVDFTDNIVLIKKRSCRMAGFPSVSLAIGQILRGTVFWYHSLRKTTCISF
jgi:hypothetical protein